MNEWKCLSLKKKNEKKFHWKVNAVVNEYRTFSIDWIMNHVISIHSFIYNELRINSFGHICNCEYFLNLKRFDRISNEVNFCSHNLRIKNTKMFDKTGNFILFEFPSEYFRCEYWVWEFQQCPLIIAHFTRNFQYSIVHATFPKMKTLMVSDYY